MPISAVSRTDLAQPLPPSSLQSFHPSNLGPTLGEAMPTGVSMRLWPTVWALGCRFHIRLTCAKMSVISALALPDCRDYDDVDTPPRAWGSRGGGVSKPNPCHQKYSQLSSNKRGPRRIARPPGVREPGGERRTRVKETGARSLLCRVPSFTFYKLPVPAWKYGQLGPPCRDLQQVEITTVNHLRSSHCGAVVHESG